ncbi:MAG: ATP-binding cassette domain-containing protein [Gemmatimonadota bacterium]
MTIPNRSPSTLEIVGGTKRYGDVTALEEVSLRVAAGECVAVVGESGSGKTTLLRSFNAMVELDEGRIVVEGRELDDWNRVALRRILGYVPQEGGLLPHWTVLRNVSLVPSLLERPDPEAAARRSLERVGLPPDRFGARWPRTLSGGQRQRVAIARALASDPGVILFDEPFGALDAITRAELQEGFEELRESTGFTALFITHDLREALRLADRIAVMRVGRLEQIATVDTLRRAPATSYVRTLLRRAGVIEA